VSSADLAEYKRNSVLNPFAIREIRGSGGIQTELCFKSVCYPRKLCGSGGIQTEFRVKSVCNPRVWRNTNGTPCLKKRFILSRVSYALLVSRRNKRNSLVNSFSICELRGCSGVQIITEFRQLRSNVARFYKQLL